MNTSHNISARFRGDGTFETVHEISDRDSELAQITLADVDNDGDLDALTSTTRAKYGGSYGMSIRTKKATSMILKRSQLQMIQLAVYRLAISMA